jgi:hypothetical protein
MSKRNERWGKAITELRNAGPNGATALDLATAALRDEHRPMPKADREALGLSLGARLVEQHMAITTRSNRFVIHPERVVDTRRKLSDNPRFKQAGESGDAFVFVGAKPSA